VRTEIKSEIERERTKRKGRQREDRERTKIKGRKRQREDKERTDGGQIEDTERTPRTNLVTLVINVVQQRE
jgi:hypothetical protein